MKDVMNYPGQYGDAYEVANWLFDRKIGHESYNDPFEAGKAAILMKEAGWTFKEYQPVTGEEVWQKPSNVKDVSNLAEQTGMEFMSVMRLLGYEVVNDEDGEDRCWNCGHVGGHDIDCPYHPWNE